MNKRRIYELLSFIVLLFFSNSLPSQNPARGNWFLTADAGGYFILGDVRKLPLLSDIKGDINIGGGRELGKCWKMYAKAGYASFQQDVRLKKQPDIVVFTCDNGSIINSDLNIGFNVINAGRHKADRLVSLYFHAGIGMILFQTEGTYKHPSGQHDVGDEVSYGHSGGRVSAFEVPVGAELSLRINEQWDIYGDAVISFFNSDLVNGVESGRLTDWSAYGNVGVRYKFGRRNREKADGEKAEPKTAEVTTAKTDAVKTSAVSFVFRQNSSAIDTPDNKLALANLIEKARGKTIKSIRIIGFASPEGPEMFNEKLALRRAETAKEFIMNGLGDMADGTEFIIESEGADWPGFMRLLVSSDIEGREEIAEEIGKAENKFETLNKIVKRRPEIYRVLKPLRRADVVVIITL